MQSFQRDCVAPLGPRWPRTSALRALLLVLAIAGTGSETAWGQAYLFNHYNRIRIGEAGALEGGAYGARADDATAAWYNPAGLAKARADTVSGSATLFETTRVSIPGEQPFDATTNLGSFVGNVARLGSPEDAPRSAWSFSIALPTAWSAVSTRRFEADSVNGGVVFADKLETVLESTQHFSVIAPGIAAGWRLGSSSRAGLGVRVYAVDLESTATQVTNQRGDATVQVNDQFVSNQSLRGAAYLWRIEGGMQWDLSDAVVVGTTLRSASGVLSSNGSVRLRSLSAFNNTNSGKRVTSSFTIDQDTDFDYRLPVELALAIGWRWERWEAEVDVVHHQAIPRYNLLGKTKGTAVSDDGTSLYRSEQRLEPFAVEARAVTNYAVGGRLRIGESISLHGGVFTEASPGAEPKGPTVKQVFDTTDLAGLTFGASKQRPGGSTTLGVLYTEGSGSEVVNDPVTRTAVRSTVRVRILGILLAGSVYF